MNGVIKGHAFGHGSGFWKFGDRPDPVEICEGFEGSMRDSVDEKLRPTLLVASGPMSTTNTAST